MNESSSGQERVVWLLVGINTMDCVRVTRKRRTAPPLGAKQQPPGPDCLVLNLPEDGARGNRKYGFNFCRKFAPAAKSRRTPGKNC